MNSNTHITIAKSSSPTLLVALALSANALIVGFIYYFHQQQLDEREKQHESTVLLREKEILELKEEIRILEGVSTWEETQIASFFKVQ
jgi:uncharacterized protein HemX